ncbi:hypothetical protein Q8A67_014897 [Cirrhinus molitorella]|uniref:Uncharacterized protein n=1 Tax=Cirrhinus molitorella TaxID=172907 RepID=A0AA88PSC6_9TELE|nr:hypothetical protein Q8A67_014897 [Cirrhinus molitorella]
MGLGIGAGIEAIDPNLAISAALLPSVKPLLEGDGFCRPEQWINGGEVTAGSGAVAIPLGQGASGHVCVMYRQFFRSHPLPCTEGHGLKEKPRPHWLGWARYLRWHSSGPTQMEGSALR